jgi:20S proteasome subunit alpha 6
MNKVSTLDFTSDGSVKLTEYIGVRSDGSFRILEGEPIQVFIDSMVPKETVAPAEETPDAPTGGEDVVMGE